jgi:hypothetical protein
MPLYDYQTKDGSVVSLLVPVDQRDQQAGLSRILCPLRVNVVTCPTPCPSDAHPKNVLAGYHRLECEQGSRFKSDFTPQQIKKAWS